MYNSLRENRRKQMANQYVNFQCEVLYYDLCGKCEKVELPEKEKEQMIQRAKKPLEDCEYHNYKNFDRCKKKYTNNRRPHR